jgi:hypothetical protein
MEYFGIDLMDAVIVLGVTAVIAVVIIEVILQEYTPVRKAKSHADQPVIDDSVAPDFVPVFGLADMHAHGSLAHLKATSDEQASSPLYSHLPGNAFHNSTPQDFFLNNSNHF